LTDTFLAGDFLSQEGAARAIVNLKAEGVSSADLAVFSDEPIEFPRSVLHRPSHMSLAVVTGAVAFCLLIIGFVYFTQHNYPIVTGGMPIFSFWATGVVFYEITMFGAIITTFFWFLRESGLLRRGHRMHAPHVAPGIISLRVDCRHKNADTVRRSLLSAGAENVRTLGDAR
jgi:Alternative complex III, ActD subunit